jgi:SAM-dependent methyltransferase
MIGMRFLPSCVAPTLPIQHDRARNVDFIVVNCLTLDGLGLRQANFPRRNLPGYAKQPIDMPNSDHPSRPVVVEARSRAADARQYSPSAARNREPILEVLTRVLPEKGIVLEIGSGTGEHVALFAKALPRVVWLPSDPDEASRASIKAWITTDALANTRAPVALDVRGGSWGVEEDAPFDAMISLNMVHIAPWDAALGLFAGAGRLLRPEGLLFLYGPFMLGGTHTAASNAAFDADLRRRDPRWGVRDVDELVREGAVRGLELREIVKMPANNLSLVFVKRRAKR